MHNGVPYVDINPNALWAAMCRILISCYIKVADYPGSLNWFMSHSMSKKTFLSNYVKREEN